MDWSPYFPGFVAEDQPSREAAASAQEGAHSAGEEPERPKRLSKDVEVADIGCGFGGLLVALAPVFPDTLMLGMRGLTPALRPSPVPALT